MSDVVLGAGARPALDADEVRRARDAQHGGRCLRSRSRRVRHRRAVTAPGSARRRGMRAAAPCPAGARSCHFDDTQVHAVIRKRAVLARDDEAAAGEGMIDARPRPGERDAHGRDVRHLRAERRERRVGAREQPCRRVRRRGQDHGARVERSRRRRRPAIAGAAHETVAHRASHAHAAGRQPALDRRDELAHPAAQRLEESVAGSRAARRGALKSGPRAAAADESWRDRRDGELLDVAGVDAAEQRLRDAG